MQEKKIIHLNVQPSSILVNNSKAQILEFKLGGFHLAESSDSENLNGKHQDVFIKSPENLLGMPYNESIDVWGLGVTVCQYFLDTNEGVFYPPIRCYENHIVRIFVLFMFE